MKTLAGSVLVLCATVHMAASAAAQTPAGALAIDERQGDQDGWIEISGRPDCYVRNAGYAEATVTWTGECSSGLAQGIGSLTWVWDGYEQVDTGRLQDGERTGHWVGRDADGDIAEGPYVDGERNGLWVFRFVGGDVAEGPYVDGSRTGYWMLRFADGTVEEGPYVDGSQTGHWVLRSNGDVAEGPYVDGSQTGHWVFRFANRDVTEGPYVDGAPQGDWVFHFADGRVYEGRIENGELVEYVEIR